MQKFLIRNLFLVLPFSMAEGWALPLCQDADNERTWNNYHGGTYDFSSGEKYTGEFKNG